MDSVRSWELLVKLYEQLLDESREILEWLPREAVESPSSELFLLDWTRP